MTSPPQTSKEPTIALPTGRMVGSIVGLSTLTAVVWLAVVWIGGFDAAAGTAGVAGAAVVAIVSVAASLMMRPWRPVFPGGGLQVLITSPPSPATGARSAA